MTKKFAIQIIFLLIVIFVALAISTGKFPQLPLPFTPQVAEVANLKVGENILKVEIADTKEKRSQGLGGRESLASESGMLFVFEREDRFAFWMKSMKFSLDFIWIKDEKVVDFIKNAQAPLPGQKDNELPLYAPNQPIDSLLEVNAGYIDSKNVKVGDEVKIIK